MPRLSRRWFTIGLELGLKPEQLEEVQVNRCDVDRDGCLKDALAMWEYCNTARPYSWTTVLEVLRSKKIGEDGLANLLSQRFIK